MNLRQYTQEGTFGAFAKQLPRLRDMGVDILWFMPIQPIGVESRKGPLGSYYAIRDYTATNPEHGSLKDFKKMVERAHELGMKVMLDWVANHTARDHDWVKKHPGLVQPRRQRGNHRALRLDGCGRSRLRPARHACGHD